MASTPIAKQRGGTTTPRQSTGPVKSILRSGPPSVTDTVLGARKRDEEEEESPVDPESPSKRRKTVHFDMSLNVTTEVGTRSLEETKQAVKRALDSHAAGDDQDYDELKDVFAHDREPYLAPIAGDEEDSLKPEELVVYVVALTSYAPLLNKSCFTLVKKVLESSWLGRDETFFRAFVQFLAALVSAQGASLRPVLEMMIDKFKESRPSSWSVPDFASVDRETMQTRLHSGLRYILQLFPAARSVVCTLISQKFPYADESKSTHMIYIDNLLRLQEYATDLRLDVMELITHQTVKLDSDFFLDLSDMDDDLVARVVFQLNSSRSDPDGDDAESEAESDDDLDPDDPDYDEEASRIEKMTRLVQKLDLTLDTLFSMFTPTFSNPDSDIARSCFEDMLSDFTNYVLAVPSSRHTQFLVFHFSQRSPALQDMFTGTLLNLAFESNRPTATRLAAVAYLGSYISRGARIQQKTVRDVARILLGRIETFRSSFQESCRGPDLRRYRELYSWVQAILYIFCFRWRDLVQSCPDEVYPEDPASYFGQELEWMPGLKETLTNIIYSKFDPLKVCSPHIVQEFAKLAHALRFRYLFTKIATNTELHVTQLATGEPGYDGQDERWLRLESVWPFDPFLLPRSKRWLDGDYVAWIPVTDGAKGEEAAEDSDDADVVDTEPFEEDTATDDDDDDN